MSARFRQTLRRYRRWRAGRRPVAIAAAPAHRERVTEQGNRIDVAVLRGFLKRALEDDAVADPRQRLLFEHVVIGRSHPRS